MKKNIVILILTMNLMCQNTSISANDGCQGREAPKKYIDQTINYFNKQNGKVIVEIGSMRAVLTHNIDTEKCAMCCDGHSTYLWGKTLAEVYSIDINPDITSIVKYSCKNFKNVNAITQDGIEFLKNFNKPIDLLFLDAWDVIPGTSYAEKHLEAYEVSKKNLHEKSLILIDDTDVSNGGKGKLVIPKALKDGYKIIFSGRQTLLAKHLAS